MCEQYNPAIGHPHVFRQPVLQPHDTIRNARVGATSRYVVCVTKLSSLYFQPQSVGHNLFPIHCCTSFLTCPSHKLLPRAGTCRCHLCDDGEVFRGARLINLPATEEVGHCLRFTTVADDWLRVVNVPHLLVVVLARPILVALQYRHSMNGTWRLRQLAATTHVWTLLREMIDWLIECTGCNEVCPAMSIWRLHTTLASTLYFDICNIFRGTARFSESAQIVLVTIAT